MSVIESSCRMNRPLECGKERRQSRPPQLGGVSGSEYGLPLDGVIMQARVFGITGWTLVYSFSDLPPYVTVHNGTRKVATLTRLECGKVLRS